MMFSSVLLNSTHGWDNLWASADNSLKDRYLTRVGTSGSNLWRWNTVGFIRLQYDQPVVLVYPMLWYQFGNKHWLFDVLKKKLLKKILMKNDSNKCVGIYVFELDWLNLTCWRHQMKTFSALSRVYTRCARMRAYTRAYADCRRSCLYFCRRLRPAHTPTVAVKVQTCWTFKASADQRRHSSQSRKRPKVTEGRRVVLHRDVCGRIPTHTLACLYFNPRRNLCYAVATHRQPQAWTSAPAVGAFARMEYKPGFTGPLCGEFTGPRWIPLTKASDAELWCFL